MAFLVITEKQKVAYY